MRCRSAVAQWREDTSATLQCIGYQLGYRPRWGAPKPTWPATGLAHRAACMPNTKQKSALTLPHLCTRSVERAPSACPSRSCRRSCKNGGTQLRCLRRWHWQGAVQDAAPPRGRSCNGPQPLERARARADHESGQVRHLGDFHVCPHHVGLRGRAGGREGGQQGGMTSRVAGFLETRSRSIQPTRLPCVICID